MVWEAKCHLVVSVSSKKKNLSREKRARQMVTSPRLAGRVSLESHLMMINELPVEIGSRSARGPE